MRQRAGLAAAGLLLTGSAMAADWAPGAGNPDPHAVNSMVSRPVAVEVLVTEALQNNPEIGAARSEREAAAQRVLPAGALDDPMLEAGVLNAPLPSLSLRREDMTMKMLGLSQKLPFPGKRGLRQEIAAREADSIGYAYQETVNRTVRDIKAAYFDLATVIESTRVVEKTRQVLEQFLGTANARYAVGQGSQADVLRAQTQLSRLGDELIRLGRERRVIEAELIRLLGRRPEPGKPVTAPVPEGLHLGEATLRVEALREIAFEERPQLLALQALIDRSEKARDLARREYFPDFDVRFSYGQRSDMSDGTDRDDMLSLTVAVNLPIWRKDKLAPQLAEATVMRRQAMEIYTAQQNEVTAGLRKQAESVAQARRSARLYETEILPQARLTVESSLAAYKVDRVDFLTLLDSQMSLFDYEINYVEVLSSYNKALAEIDLLTGQSGQ